MHIHATPSTPATVPCLIVLLALAADDLRPSSGLAAGALAPDDSPPMAAAAGIMNAYESMDASALASLLTDDFRFVSDDPERPELGDPGFSRDDEIAAAANLFHGKERRWMGRLPAARSIAISVRSWSDHPRFGPPGSPPSGGVVAAIGVTMELTFEDGTTLAAGPACHVFDVVRGDLATLPGGGHGDPGRYYVRRWSEYTRDDCDRLAATGSPRGRGEPDTGTQSTARLGCGIRAVREKALGRRPRGGLGCGREGMSCSSRHMNGRGDTN
jgi:hypothetical protein